MLNNLFKSKSNEEVPDNNTQIIHRISTMKLTDMRSYVRNSLKDFPVCETGLKEVMRILVDYIKIDDMPSKKKKAFDLVILIAKNNKITIDTVEYIQKFLENNKDLIYAYDREFKEIYESRLDDALNMALQNIEEITKLQNKMHVLGE